MRKISCFTNKLRLQYCAKVMQTKFVENRPLFSRIFHEKSSGFQKIFGRVQSKISRSFLKIRGSEILSSEFSR